MILLRELAWFFKLEGRRYTIGIIALVLVAVFNLLPPQILGQLVDEIAKGTLSQKHLWLHLLYLLAVAVLMYGLRYLWRQYILGTANHLGRILRLRLFEQLTKMSPSFYQRYRTGDLMAHATNDISAVTMTAGAGVMSAVDASITALVTLATMLVGIDWRLTLVAIAPLPLMAWSTTRLGHRNHISFKAAQEAFSDLNNKVQESVSGIKVTKSFGYQTDTIRDFAATNQEVYGKNVTAAKYHTLFDPLVRIFVGLSYLLTLLLGTVLINSRQLTIGQLVTFIAYLDMLVWPLMAMGFLLNTIQRGRVSYERIASLLAEDRGIQDPKDPIEPVSNGPLVYEIEHFAYRDIPTLEKIHFRLEQGQTLGIVGPTGSGKTTLLKLLLREYDINQGSISLNDQDIRHYRLQDLRRLIGYVPQEPILFATTIRDNIRFGNPNLGEDAVIGAAKLCGVYEDIMAMPEGFDTFVGERGVSLSGGQKQRLAMSRALIMDPEILVLDDSLSAVDAKTEHVILENLRRVRKGKTTIITSHRLSAIVHSEVILVMAGGCLAELGNHDQLMAARAWYYNTYQSQQLASRLERELYDSHIS